MRLNPAASILSRSSVVRAGSSALLNSALISVGLASNCSTRSFIEPWNENLASVMRTDLERELKAPAEKKLLFVLETCRRAVPRLE